MKPSIENVTKKKRAGPLLAKKASKKKKVSTSFDYERIEEDEVDLGLNIDSQKALSQHARDDEVRMISLVFNSRVLTPPMLTPLGDYFQNLASTFHSDENVGGGSLSSPQKNTGEDTLPSSSPIVDDAATVVAIAIAGAQTEEDEIVTMAS